MLLFVKRILLGLTLALFLLPVAWMLAGHEADSPYVATELFQQVYLTDEGMYTKGALWFARHGQLCPPHDFCSYVTYPAFTIGLGTAMRTFGDSRGSDYWRVGRAYSIYLSLLALAAFWTLCRVALPPLYSGLAVVSAALAFQYLHASRLATADPSGIAFCVLSAAVWVRWPGSTAAVALALALGLIGLFTKSSYAAYVAALGLCIAWEALTLWRAGRRGQAAAQGLVLLAAAAGSLAVRHALSGMNPAMTVYEGNLYLWKNLGFGVSLGTGVRTQLRSLFQSAPWLPGVPVLIAVALAGLWPGGPIRQGLNRNLREAAGDPGFRLFALWTAIGVSLFGLSHFVGGRYYFYTIFPAAYAAFWTLHRSAAEPLRAPAVAVLAAILHLVSQGNFYHHWYLQAESPSYLAVSRDIASKIAGGGPVRLAGHGFSDWISLFDARITSIGWGYASYAKVFPLQERMRYWRPDYVLINDDDFWLNSESWAKFQRENSDLIERSEPVAEYRFLFRNVYPNSPSNRQPNLKLLRLHYARGALK
jgi:hypothetical protein